MQTAKEFIKLHTTSQASAMHCHVAIVAGDIQALIDEVRRAALLEVQAICDLPEHLSSGSVRWIISGLIDKLDAEAGRTESTERPSAMQRLENWYAGHKARAVKIDIDDGYGAASWGVTLWMEGKRKVECYEAAGLPLEGADKFCLYNDDPDCKYEDWPGLEATIHAAIDRAEVAHGG